MTMYYAAVKYALDDTKEQKRRALTEGLGTICMELVAEYDFDLGQLERALEDAQCEAELELDMKRTREEDKSE
jgi:hypothetical protein